MNYGYLSLCTEHEVNHIIERRGPHASTTQNILEHAFETCNDETANKGIDFLYSQKYLLDINNSSEVMTNASPALMHSLVLKDYHFPQRSKRGGKYNHKSGASAVREKRASSRNIPTSGKGSIKSKGGFGKKKKGLR